MNTENYFDRKTMSAFVDKVFVFDREEFINRLTFFIDLQFSINHMNVYMYGAKLCQDQHNIAFGAFAKVSFHYRFKNLVSITVDDKELFDNYQKLLEVGVNQFLFKVIDLKKAGIDTAAEYIRARMIINEGVNDVADDIEELLNNK